MSLADAFLADIVAHPDDDAPRLIFADWLEEHDDPARAEFIRVQCALARHEAAVKKRGDGFPAPPMPPDFLLSSKHDELCRRKRELLHAGYPERSWIWAGEPIQHVPNAQWSFRRGFVAAVTLSCADWLAHREALLAACPLEEVTLTHYTVKGTGLGATILIPGDGSNWPPLRCAVRAGRLWDADLTEQARKPRPVGSGKGSPIAEIIVRPALDPKAWAMPREAHA